MKILVISPTFPSIADPLRGVFVKERIKALAALPGYEVRVVAPVPWFPPLKRFKKWYAFSQYPNEEVIEGLQVYHPRYVLPPVVGGYLHSELMYPFVKRLAKRIRQDFAFDLIDAHFVYPGGVVAANLARHFKLPVTMTGRGEDMRKFPDLPVVGKRIQAALRASDCSIGVSREIADKMVKNGSTPERTVVLANGIDSSKFFLMNQAECRDALKVPSDSKVLLSVGELIELKGFHLLVEAMPKLLERHPKLHLYIIGRPGRFGRDCTPDLKERIEKHSLQNNVTLVGAVPHDKLKVWFNAADLFALMSSAEGSPNVLLEAMACGVPAVATAVGGIPDELSDSFLGTLLPERTSECAANVIHDSLMKLWDRERIAEHMRKRSWSTVATQFAQLLQSANLNHRQMASGT